MNTKQLIALTVLTAAGTAAMAAAPGVTTKPGFAGDITVATENFVPMRTRADVQAEVLAARAAGVLQFSTEAHASAAAPRTPMASTVTREEVRAELARSVDTEPMRYNPAA